MASANINRILNLSEKWNTVVKLKKDAVEDTWTRSTSLFPGLEDVIYFWSGSKLLGLSVSLLLT